MNEATILRILVALARALDIDPYDLAMKYMDEDENQELFDKFFSLAAESKD